MLANPAPPAQMPSDWNQGQRGPSPIPLGRDDSTKRYDPKVAADGDELVVVFDERTSKTPVVAGRVVLVRVDAKTGILTEWPPRTVAGDALCAASQASVARAGPGLFAIAYRNDCADGGRIAVRFLTTP